MTFTIFAGKKKLGQIEAKDLEEAKKKAKKDYPNWSEIYIGKRKTN